MTIDDEVKALTAERDAKLAALGQEPRWWWPLSRRRWRKKRAAIMATDTRWMTVWLRREYSADVVTEMANRQSAFMAFITKKAGVK